MSDYSTRNELTKPVLPGTAASDYERYLRTDELLALQKPAGEMRHADEMTFQVIHQSSELLLKGACFELERVREHITKAEFRDAAPHRFPTRADAPGSDLLEKKWSPAR